MVKKLASWGLREVCLRSGQDNSSLALVAKVQERRQWPTTSQESPLRSHQSLGGVERWHRLLQEEVRALRLQLEAKVGETLGPAQPLVAWMVRHAAWILFRYHVPRDAQRTPYATVYGKNFSGPIMQFGESALARVPEDLQGGVRRTNKWESRWIRGIWLGRTAESNEHLLWADARIEAQVY